MVRKQKKKIGIIVALALFFSAFSSIALPQYTYADYPPDQGGKCTDGSSPTKKDAQGNPACDDATAQQSAPGQQPTAQNQQNTEGTTCAIEKIGWILCPIIESAAKVGDFAFNFLADHFLEIEPELLTDKPSGGAGTITAWQQARDIANIGFVIAFVIIIYSQITGSGLNNYGIKRMLPRLIIAAIAVNTSYYVCQAIVDLSNLLGYNIMQALQDISNQIGPQVLGPDTSKAINTQTASTGGWLATIAVGILAIAGLVWLLLPVLGSVVIFIVVTCLAVIIILLLRKAFIVLLVVLSPIAFVAYLLPNTEKFFNKWLSMFWKLLMVFPIVALLLGAGQLASTIIMVAGAQEQAPDCKQTNTAQQAPAQSGGAGNSGYQTAGECSQEITLPDGSKKQVGATLGLVAAGIAVAPLLGVWAVLQGALAAAGAIGGKIGGAMQNVNKGSRNRLNKAMGERKEDLSNRLNNRAALNKGGLTDIATGGTFRRRRMKRDAVRGNIKRELGRSTEDYITDQIGDGNSKFAKQMARGSGEGGIDRVRAGAAGIIAKREDEDTKNQQALMQSTLRNTRGLADSKGSTKDEDKLANMLEQAIKNGDKAGVEAATNMLMSMGSPGKEKIRDKIDTAGKGAADFRAHITQSHSSLKSTDADVYKAASDNMSLTDSRTNAATFAGLTNDQLASQSKDALTAISAQTALSARTAIIDEKGVRHETSRGRAILASKAGSEIKGSNTHEFDKP